MNQILCSTGAIIGRPNGRDYHLLGPAAEQLTCDGFEFMIYETWYSQLEALVHYVTDLGLNIPTFHMDKQIGELMSRNETGDVLDALLRFRINCQVAQAFGAKLAVLHLWGGVPSDRDIEHNFIYYEEMASTAAGYGLQLTVENVICNHADPQTHLRTMAERFPGVAFTFDTKMAQFHRQLEAIAAPENRAVAQAIRHVHANDYGGAYMDWSNLRVLHPGEGLVDFEGFFRTLFGLGYTGDFTVEATSFRPDGTIRFDALAQTFETLRALIARTQDQGGNV